MSLEPIKAMVSDEIAGHRDEIAMTIISVADAPFGKVRHSGFGSEGGPEGLAAFQVTKAVHMV